VTGGRLSSAAWALRMSSRDKKDGLAVMPNTLVRAVTSFDGMRESRRSTKAEIPVPPVSQMQCQHGLWLGLGPET